MGAAGRRCPGISPQPGLAATELVEALEDGRVKAVWIVATNPVVSQPDAERFAAALRRAELVVVQDAYHPTETAALAHVAAARRAVAGEGRHDDELRAPRRAGPGALDPPGDALPDWEIFARVGRALGYRDAFAWRTAAEVFDEYVAHDRRAGCATRPGCRTRGCAREGPLQWPCPARGPRATTTTAPSGSTLGRRFPTPTGRARFAPTPHTEPADAPDDGLPARAQHRAASPTSGTR